jgi:hypothetical protein
MDILRIRKDDLIQKAEAFGVGVDHNWTKQQIADAIEKTQSPDDAIDINADEGRTVNNINKPSGVRNISGHRWQVYSQDIAPGDVYVPTDKDLADKRGSRKIERAANMGKLEYI